MRYCWLIGIFFCAFSLQVLAQTEKYAQLHNEIRLARTINDKWAGELYIGGAFSNTPSNNRMLSTNIQRYVVLWVHYYLSPKWKLSSSFAYYYNKDVPDIGQYFSPEYRLTIQGNYYFHKTGYTLLTRMRGEIRFIMDKDGVFQDNYRYRQMLKYLQPLNAKYLRKGVVYFIITEELLFKPKAKTEGVTFFDRNRIEIGGGYLFTDNIQLELTYLNEFMPRDDNNQVYNGIQLKLTFNNLFRNLRKKIFPKSDEPGQAE